MMFILALLEPAHAAACTVDGGVACYGYYSVPTDFFDDDTKYGCTGATSYGGSEDTLTLTPPSGADVTVHIENLGGASNIDLMVHKSSCSSTATCAAKSTSNGNTERVDFVADGSTYYVTTDDKSGSILYTYLLSIGCGDGSCTPTDVDSPVSCSTDISGTTRTGSDVLNYYECGKT
jgi:hypothetical protein